MSGKIKILVIDDSAFIRQILSDMFESDPAFNLVGTAIDAQDARAKIKALNPDVITLDIEMPGMNGLDFLEKIMTLRPMPVVMVSTLTKKGANATLRALEIGAIDYVAKPSGQNLQGDALHTLSAEIKAKVKIAASAKVGSIKNRASSQSGLVKVNGVINKSKMIVIGSSTGGVEALKEVLIRLPGNMPPIIIVQHMPEKFTKSFAERLDGICQLTVNEAANNMPVHPGNVYIAKGGEHLKIEKSGVRYVCRVGGTDNFSGHCPSVDVMFESVAENVKSDIVGVILTGMGKDGAEGMLKLRKAGAFNISQDEQSCIVYGMPKEAKLVGATHIEAPLLKIADEIAKKCVD